MPSYGYALIDPSLLNKRILVVDDEEELALMVCSILENAGFVAVDTAPEAKSALTMVEKAEQENSPYSLFILDIMMPEMDGFSLLETIRQTSSASSIPAIFLTARDEPSDKISGFILGADDYISKPFLPQELLLRIAAVLRRCYQDESPELKLADSTVNFDTAMVTKSDGTQVQLTAKEHNILQVLARNAGRIVTMDVLCESCWGTSFGYENSLMAHIRRLREKIEANPSSPKSLITVKGLGYKLEIRR